MLLMVIQKRSWLSNSGAWSLGCVWSLEVGVWISRRGRYRFNGSNLVRRGSINRSWFRRRGIQSMLQQSRHIVLHLFEARKSYKFPVLTNGGSFMRSE